jgi:phosphorylcholine metabolism protein LicD
VILRVLKRVVLKNSFVINFIRLFVKNDQTSYKLKKSIKQQRPLTKMGEDIESIKFQLELFLTHYVDLKKATPAKSWMRHVQLTRLKALEEVAEVLERNNIVYWLGYGTLLGVYRHNGFIPWDNDIDICVFQKDFSKVNDVITRNCSRFNVIDANDVRSFSPKNCFYKIFDKETNYEYFDIFAFTDAEEDGFTAGIYVKELGSYAYNEIPMKAIIPLGKAVFEGREYFVPNDIETYLQLLYGNIDALPKNWTENAERDRTRKFKFNSDMGVEPWDK